MMEDAVGYTRISVKDQSRYSPEYQEKRITDFAKYNNFNLVSVFRDNGEDSYTFDRPDWLSLEKFIKANSNVKYLIVYDRDRFSRNLVEALLKEKELFDKYGVVVMPTTESVDTDRDDPAAYMVRAFKYMMSESELMKIRERTRSGIHQATLNGYFVNRAPFGYVNIRTEDDKPTLEIDPVRGPIVKKIFKLYAKGVSPASIKKEVRPLFTLTSKSAIQEMVRNPVYMGKVKVKAYKKIPEHFVEGWHRGIVTEREFAEAQIEQKTVKVQQKDEVPLRGVLKCWCGRLVTAGNSRNRKGNYYWYYLCNTHRQNFSAIKLHEQMNEILSNLSLSEQDVLLIQSGLAKRMGKMIDEITRNSGALKAKIAVINKRIKDAEKKYLSNTDISEKSFRELITDLKAEREEIENRLLLQSSTEADFIKQMEIMLPKLLDLKNAYNMMNTEKKQRFLKIIFGENLTYLNNSYRTQSLNKLFKHKELILKEKGLLISNPEIEKTKIIPLRIGERTSIELLRELLVTVAG